MEKFTSDQENLPSPNGKFFIFLRIWFKKILPRNFPFKLSLQFQFPRHVRKFSKIKRESFRIIYWTDGEIDSLFGEFLTFKRIFMNFKSSSIITRVNAQTLIKLASKHVKSLQDTQQIRWNWNSFQMLIRTWFMRLMRDKQQTSWILICDLKELFESRLAEIFWHLVSLNFIASVLWPRNEFKNLLNSEEIDFKDWDVSGWSFR